MERRERRRRIYSERVDWLMMEVYTMAPTIVFRYIPTGRFVAPPPSIFLKVVMGAETGGGKEPFEVETIAAKEIPIDNLRKLDPFKVREFLDEVEKELYKFCVSEASTRFGSFVANMLEERGRELTIEKLPALTVRYRHPRKYTTWKVFTYV